MGAISILLCLQSVLHDILRFSAYTPPLCSHYCYYFFSCSSFSSSLIWQLHGMAWYWDGIGWFWDLFRGDFLGLGKFSEKSVLAY